MTNVSCKPLLTDVARIARGTGPMKQSSINLSVCPSVPLIDSSRGVGLAGDIDQCPWAPLLHTSCRWSVQQEMWAASH